MASGSTSAKRTAVRGLGEIALRVNDQDGMQVLALFHRSETPGYREIDGATSTIDHIAFEIPLADYVGEKRDSKHRDFE